MKNVFFIVIDSFFAEKIGNTKYGPTPTPFLDELSKKSIVCKNMYSQGPHTEAGSRALLTGFDSMDYGGYMHNLHEAKSTYLDVFKKAGYTTFDFFLPYYMYSTREFKSIDYTYFTSDFLYESVWGHRLTHFAEISKKRSLTELEMYDVKKQLELTFIAWGNWFDKWISGERECFNAIKVWSENYDWQKNYKLFKAEYDEFLKDEEKYAKIILEEGEASNLYKIERFDFDTVLNQKFLEENVYYRHKKFLKEIERKQFLFNLKNQKLDYKNLLYSIGKTIKEKELVGYLRGVVYALCCGKFAQNYKRGKFDQILPSMRNFFRTALDGIEKHNDGKPIMLHCHPEELHNRINYFSYDINDSELINHEFELFENYIKNINKSYRGNILYDCALLYVDDCLKEFFTKLKEKSLLESSLVVICADHGSSYTCNTIRESVTNNCHTENYHIPLIIYDGASPHGFINTKFHTSKDILATVYDLCGIAKPEYVTGEPITENSGDNIAVTEYIDSGTPDLRTRPIIFVARNNEYMIHYRVSAFEDFKNGSLLEVYSLRKDPLELKNIKENISQLTIQPLLDACEVRQRSISNTYKKLHPDFDYTLYR